MPLVHPFSFGAMVGVSEGRREISSAKQGGEDAGWMAEGLLTSVKQRSERARGKSKSVCDPRCAFPGRTVLLKKCQLEDGTRTLFDTLQVATHTTKHARFLNYRYR
jgi:hypothetical protein